MTRKKAHKQLFGTHPVPGQSHKCVYVYVFFSFSETNTCQHESTVRHRTSKTLTYWGKGKEKNSIDEMPRGAGWQSLSRANKKVLYGCLEDTQVFSSSTAVEQSIGAIVGLNLQARRQSLLWPPQAHSPAFWLRRGLAKQRCSLRQSPSTVKVSDGRLEVIHLPLGFTTASQSEAVLGVNLQALVKISDGRLEVIHLPFRFAAAFSKRSCSQGQALKLLSRSLMAASKSSTCLLASPRHAKAKLFSGSSSKHLSKSLMAASKSFTSLFASPRLPKAKMFSGSIFKHL